VVVDVVAVVPVVLVIAVSVEVMPVPVVPVADVSVVDIVADESVADIVPVVPVADVSAAEVVLMAVSVVTDVSVLAVSSFLQPKAKRTSARIAIRARVFFILNILAFLVFDAKR